MLLNPSFPDATVDQKWRQFRQWRAVQLATSDWTQLPDAPLSEAKKDAWRKYRQALRDMPAKYKTVESIKWPTPPE